VSDLGLTGRVAVITGGAYGIGYATGRGLLNHGASVVLADVREEALEHALSKIPATVKDRCWIKPLDVLVPADVQTVFADVADEQGGIDILVNNVGGRGSPPGLEATPAECERELDLCMTSTFLCTRAALPIMCARQGGAIVNVSSSAGRYYSDMAGVPYCAGKAGVLALTRSIAAEYGSRNIRCNAVAPGSTLTEQGRIDWEALPQAQRTAILERIPAQRLAEPDDIADVIVFLASPVSRYVNGAVIDVNGGQHMM
jgi:3-oxoacyl-[acyl-carrier protein] reductase